MFIEYSAADYKSKLARIPSRRCLFASRVNTSGVGEMVRHVVHIAHWTTCCPQWEHYVQCNMCSAVSCWRSVVRNAARCRNGIFHHRSVTCNTIWSISCPAHLDLFLQKGKFSPRPRWMGWQQMSTESTNSKNGFNQEHFCDHLKSFKFMYQSMSHWVRGISIAWAYGDRRSLPQYGNSQVPD